MPESLTLPARLARAKFRAWHRGTREADYIFGGYFDRYGEGWDDAELIWFERLLDEDETHVMAWALGTMEVPHDFAGEQMELLKRLDFVEIER